jgi:hypothetical protein
VTAHRWGESTGFDGKGFLNVLSGLVIQEFSAIVAPRQQESVPMVVVALRLVGRTVPGEDGEVDTVDAMWITDAHTAGRIAGTLVEGLARTGDLTAMDEFQAGFTTAGAGFDSGD